MMLGVAVVLFALAALLGITLAVQHLKKKNAPISVALVHGLAAAVGLVLLIVAVVNMSSAGPAGVALAIFVIAAIGGFILFAMHLAKKLLPPALIVLHGLLAAVAFVVLLVALLHS